MLTKRAQWNLNSVGLCDGGFQCAAGSVAALLSEICCSEGMVGTLVRTVANRDD